MTPVTAVLLAVATELSSEAKASLPKLAADERVLREWFEGGVYYRETTLNGEIFQSQYDFRQRKSRQMAVVK